MPDIIAHAEHAECQPCGMNVPCQEEIRMKLAVVCANGKAGQLITKEAVDRGLDVTAVIRGKNQSAAKKVISKDILHLTANDLKNFDVVIDAYGVWMPEELDGHSTTQNHLCDLLSGTKIRLLIVGGAGSLYLNPQHTVRLMDSPEFPGTAKPVAKAMAKALDELRTRKDVRWTYISPAGDFRADGERTGKYILGGEELILNSKGESMISYADYAIAMIDEAVSGRHIQKRISVVRK